MSKENSCGAVLLCFLLALGLFLVFYPELDKSHNDDERLPFRKATPSSAPTCDQPCRVSIAETIPAGASFNSSVVHRSIHEEWLDLITKAENYIEISSPVWNISTSSHPRRDPTIKVSDALYKTRRRNVKLFLVLDPQAEKRERRDPTLRNLYRLAKMAIPKFYQLDGGFLNSRFIIIDGKHMYLGSADMNWRALHQNDLGIVIRDCPCLVADLQKIFAVYWKMGNEHLHNDPFVKVESQTYNEMHDRYQASYNSQNPLRVMLDKAESEVYFTSSPPDVNPKRWENELDAIIRLIEDAKETICVSVMEYQPIDEVPKRMYWPDLDTALRAAAFKNVTVKMLVSKLYYKDSDEQFHLDSLARVSSRANGSIEIKYFFFPTTNGLRPSHKTYMVTENAAYIGASNWVGKYFTKSASVGLVVSSKGSNSLQEQLQAMFDRDWNSDYSHPLA